MFSAEITSAIKAHAIAEFPRESCGVVTGDAYIACTNVAGDPLAEWRISPDEFLRFSDVKAVVHSHPNGPDHPSSADMAQQLASGLTFGIVSCNAEAAFDPFFWGPIVYTPPLRGREFRHGPSGSDGKGDCYALCRDWYRLEMKIDLPEVPRDDAWWNNGGDLYSEFEKHGFRKVDLRDVRYGDGLLAQIRSSVPNHAGVYVGNGLILHHLHGRLSRMEPAGSWSKHLVHVVRHESIAS
jgi:proteasome lid subunit RPN8/RPN11